MRVAFPRGVLRSCRFACHLHSLVTAPHSTPPFPPCLPPSSIHPSHLPLAVRVMSLHRASAAPVRRWFGNGVSLVGPPRDRGSCSHPLLTQSVTHFAFAAIVDFQPRTAGRTEPSRFRRRSFWSYITTTDGRRRRRSRSRPLVGVRARRHLLSSGEGRVSVGACRRWQLPGRRSSSSSSSSTVAAGAALHSHE